VVSPGEDEPDSNNDGTGQHQADGGMTGQKIKVLPTTTIS